MKPTPAKPTSVDLDPDVVGFGLRCKDWVVTDVVTEGATEGVTLKGESNTTSWTGIWGGAFLCKCPLFTVSANEFDVVDVEGRGKRFRAAGKRPGVSGVTFVG